MTAAETGTGTEAGTGTVTGTGTGTGTGWRPALARSVVLRRDEVRRADLLLLPERVVVLGGRAADVLRLCDGHRSVDEIVEELAARFPGAPVAAEVPRFLDRVHEEGWLR